MHWVSKILLRGQGGWHPLDRRDYGNEDELQRLLKDSPEIIPPPSPEASIVYCREYPTLAGPVDLLGVDSDGGVTLIECKLAKNQDVKRKVVGQLLDYAAALWGTPLAELDSTFTQLEGKSAFESLRLQAGEQWDETRCRELVTSAIERGSFRLLIAVDDVNAGLRRIIEYVNAQHGGLRLGALEFPFYTDGSTEVLVPEVYGDESVAAVAEPTYGSVQDALADQPSGVAELHEFLARHFAPRLTRMGESITYKALDSGWTVLNVRLRPDFRIYLQDVEQFSASKSEIQNAARAAGFEASGTWIQRPEASGEGLRIAEVLQATLIDHPR